jgi:hypothetical protein
MLEIAMKLPPGALIGGDDRLLAQAVLATGGARFVARESDILWTNGRITGWRESNLAVEAVAAGPNTGNSRFEAGPPGALICQDGVNCGFTLPGFASEVEAFTIAVIYQSEGEAGTLASVFAGRLNNMIFLTEGDGLLLAKDRQSTVEVTLPVAKTHGAKLAVLGYDGRSLRLSLGDAVAEAAGRVPGLAHQADFFIGCRSNRGGLAKLMGQSQLHEVLFWPDRCLPGSCDPDDQAALATLHRHLRWTY